MHRVGVAVLAVFAVVGEARAWPSLWFRADPTPDTIAAVRRARDREVMPRRHCGRHMFPQPPPSVRGEPAAEARLKALSQELSDDALGFGSADPGGE